MADQNAFLLDEDGKVVEASPEDALGLRSAGYIPAGKEQIERYQTEKAFHEKYGTVGQQIATGTEAAGSALTFGLSPLIERGLGVPAEDIRNRKEENPTAHTIGTVAGVAAPLIASGGASALGEAADLTAPALISKLGEGAGEVAEHLIGKQATGLGRILAKGASSAASGLAEGTAWGAGQVVNEAAMGDPNLTASHAFEEVGLSGLLGGGISGATGILSGLIGEAANGEIGKKISDWADTFEGNNVIKTAAGPGKGQAALTRLYKKMTPEQASALGRKAHDLGLVEMLDGSPSVYEKSNQMMEDVGPQLSDGLRKVDALPGAAKPEVGAITDRMRREVLAPLESDPAQAGAARTIRRFINGYEDSLESSDSKLARAKAIEEEASSRVSRGLSVDRDNMGGDATTTLSDLHDARIKLGKSIYGLKGDLSVSTAQKEALSDLRGILSDEITNGIEKSGVDSGEWKALNRQYSVAATINRIAEKGTAAAGLSGVPLTAVMSGLTGLIHGGPLGAAVLGGGAMLAKRYGPQVLAAGARAARNLVDEEAAAGLASKTAEAIASAREAGVEAGGATRAGMLWNKLGETLETPVVGPGQDIARDAAQERLAGGKEGGTPIETVAALSQLEAANKRVNDRVSGLARAMVSGKVARSTSQAVSAEEMAKELEHIHNLAGNPDALLQHVSAQNKDIQEHAPNTATALATVSTRAVNHLHMKFPPAPKMSPLSPTPKPNKNDLWKYNRTRDVLLKPSNLLKHAANGTMIPAQVEAVASVHPEMLKQMQQAVLEEMSSGKTVPHTARMMASILLNQPMDAGMTPQAIASNQAVFSRPSLKNGQDQAQPMGGKSTQGGLAKLNVSGHSMLPGQAVESRRSEA